MKLSFVIPAHNEEAIIGKCLESIIRESKGKEDRIEIIVVNNASTDGTKAAALKYPGVTVVDEERKGLVWARRAGFLASHGELIANVDADTMLTPHWIDKVLEAFAKDDKLVAFSGPFIYYDLPRLTQFFVRLFYTISLIPYFLNRFIFRVGSMLQGGNFIVRRDALEKIGGFDTSISFYGEDTNIARRMNKVGKVKFTFKLPINSSGRRLAKEGALTTGIRYGLNYFWMTFFKKPLTKEYSDLRPSENGATLSSDPRNRTREWTIGISIGVITLAILALGIYIVYRLVQSGVISIFSR